MGAKTHLRKGDEVLVLSGKEKGRRGKVQRVLAGKGTVIVEGLNLAKKHTKPTRSNPQGGVIDKAMPLPAGKVMLVCPACSRPARIKKERDADGSLARTCKKCGRSMD